MRYPQRGRCVVLQAERPGSGIPLAEIFPLINRKVPGVTITIVGNRPPRELLRRASDQVIITGYVDDVRPFVERASVYVAPLRIGSGTRLKILEALSMKKPVVTTSIGCEGLDILDGESALVADEPEAFASRVIELLQNGGLRRKLMRGGYELVREKYDWRIVHQRLDQAYCEVLRSARVPAVADRERLEYPEPVYAT
ncbi:MAG: glycosyltransferase [Ignavibacteria bacterium]|nr:MAG: glycosyltransferase [Ignavibacteria bacterium]